MLVQCGASVISDQTGGHNNTSRISQHRPSYCGEFFQMVVVLSQCSKERDNTAPILVRGVLYVIIICVLFYYFAST
jgi:Fe-S-cluster containining protein